MIYVLGLNCDQAVRYAVNNKITPAQLVLVTNLEQLRGLCGGVLHVLQGAAFRKDYFKIIDLATERGFTVVYVTA